MPVASTHPSEAQLAAFGLGKLSPRELAAVEAHVAECATCCERLGQLGDDTLVALAREAATANFRLGAPDEKAAALPVANKIPAELSDHPRYQITGLLGMGGMGAVYKAQHRLMEREVALKVIHPHFLSRQGASERFVREVKAAAKLAHANIVAAFDAEEVNGIHFLVMEFVDGISLDRLVAKKGPLSIAHACNFIRQVAQGLQAAHAIQLVHRDLKPHNLMVTRQGVVKILDFGLARLAMEESFDADGNSVNAPETHRTEVGLVLGTPDYIAPEQARDARSADIRSDLYSLGCTLFFLLTGQPPFPQGTPLEKLAAHQHSVPPALRTLRPDAPEELESLLNKLLAKDPAARFQEPKELVEAIKLIGKTIENPVVQPLIQVAEKKTAPSLTRSSRQLWPMALAAVVGCTMLLFAFMAWNNWSQEKPTAKIPVVNVPMSSAKTEQPANQGQPGVMATGSLKGLPILILLPSRNLWYPDYGPLRASLESHGYRVVSATFEQRTAQPTPDSPGQSVTPDAAIDAALLDKTFAGVVFVGADPTEFVRGPQREMISGLIQKYDRQGRFVAAICRGQTVLADHGYLKDKPVATNDWTQQMRPNCGARWEATSVKAHGNLITGRDQFVAEPFAQALDRFIQEH